MRKIIGVLLAAATVAPSHRLSAAQSASGPAPMQPAGTMSELMVKIIYPASDAIFYITTRQPTSESEWVELQGKALAVAESANLLMMPGRARDQDRWIADARLMLDAGRAAFKAAKSKDVAALEALNDQLYTSCTSCHQHYRANYGRRPSSAAAGSPAVDSARAADAARVADADRVESVGVGLKAVPYIDPRDTASAPPAPPASPTPQVQPVLEGRWKLRAAEDVRADGTVARLPWGAHPVGSIIVERGACYLQIMSSDTPSFATGTVAATEQMKAALLSTYIAYSGKCTVDEAEQSVTLKVDAAWRPDYVGTEQKRFFKFENGALIFGPATGSIRAGNETLTRRLTLDRVQ
jgi:hypothetical protein